MTPTAVAAQPLTPAPSVPVRGQDVGEVVRVLLVASLLGGAAVHAAVVREHVDHWPAAGVFFALLAIGGLAVGGALLLRVDRPRLLTALALSVGPLVVWLVSRTAGLPFGPEAGEPEPVALADSAACLLEVVAAGAALILLRAAPGLRARSLPAAAQLVTLSLVAVFTVVGLAGAAVAHPAHAEGPSPEHVSGGGHSHGVEDGQHI
jgi:hypothetical protein